MTNVYYADIFKINNVGCLIMGHGKSKTCRHYTGDKTETIALDSVRFERVNNRVIGYSDPTMGFLPFDKTKADSIEIKYVLRMLSEDETANFNISDAKKVNLSSIVELSAKFINTQLTNQGDRMLEFRSIFEKTEVQFLLIPWCASMEVKGSIISKNISIH